MLTPEEIQTTIGNAEVIVGAAAPALGPYAPAVILSLKLAEKVAPAVYAEILALLAKGNTTPEEDAHVRALIEELKNPGADFAD